MHFNQTTKDMKQELTERDLELLNELHSRVQNGKVINLPDKQVLFKLVIESPDKKIDKEYFKNEDNYILYEDLVEFEQFRRKRYGKE